MSDCETGYSGRKVCRPMVCTQPAMCIGRKHLVYENVPESLIVVALGSHVTNTFPYQRLTKHTLLGVLKHSARW